MSGKLNICICPNDPSDQAVMKRAHYLADRLRAVIAESLSAESEQTILLHVSEEGLSLEDRTSGASLKLDYLDKRFTQVSGRDPLVKAILPKGADLERLRLVDATLGLGRDAFGLCMRGVSVMGFEREALLLELVMDAMLQVKDVNRGYAKAVTRLRLYPQDAKSGLRVLLQQGEEACSKVDVIYVDPMFEDVHGSAQVKKEAQFLRQIVGPPIIEDSNVLMQTAMEVAKMGSGRVVVKRKPDASPLALELVGPPHHAVEGKLTRFDVYQ